MNLLAKRAGWLIASVAILIWGCKEDVGIELPPDVQRTEVKYAEFTLPVTNVYFDSLRTDSRGVTLLGQYQDDIYGSINSKSYFEVAFKSGDIVSEITVDRGDYDETIKDITFEGASLVFDINNALSSSSNISQTVEVKELQDTIYAEGLYLRNDQIETGEIITTTLLEFNKLDTMNFSNSANHLATIDLPEEYSTSLFLKFQEDSSSIVLPGFAVESTSSNGILSIDMTSNSTELILKMRGTIYDTLGFVKKDTVFSAVDFTIGRGVNYFTSIARERSGSSFATAVDKGELDPSGDAVYYNTVAGIYPKISLQPFIDFAESQQGILFNRASLEIQVEENDEFIPNNLFSQMFFSNDQNGMSIINWPNTLNFPDVLGTVLQSDSRYLTFSSTQSVPLSLFFSTFNQDSGVEGLAGNPVVFWQHVYDNVQDDLDQVDKDKRPLIRSYMTEIDNMILIPGQALVLGRNTIGKESVKLKVFYTQIR